MPGTSVNFEGTDNLDGFYPADPNGDVGPNHYVQTVNDQTQIFSKSGASVWGPRPTNVFFSGFGGACESDNDGDPVVKFDRMANRWVISQMAVTGGPPFYECVAVSTTADPTGSYYRYAFSYNDFPDYPKLAVWPDGYYATYAMYDGTSSSYLGPRTCAFDRTAMLTGAAATQQCFDPAAPYADPLLPSDLDGSTLPPTGSPNYLVGLNYTGTSGSQLQQWKFHVDWTTPANSSVTGPSLMSADAYTTPPCTTTSPSGSCLTIPQPSTAVQLDALGDRLLYRLAYRNFGDHESLVATHSVDAGGGVVGVRWYEIRSPGATPTIYQQGTHSPDTTHRWMGSVAMDDLGDLAAGYSAGSSSVSPSIRYAGRLVGDTLGTLPQTEVTLQSGSGSQTGTEGRWGDYTAMQVDPVDDCTFWYTNEYVAITGETSWQTRVGSFKFPSCASKPGAPTGPTAVAGTRQAAVSWTAPIQTGTSAISGYTVTASPAVATPPACADVSATTCIFTGLSPGTPYTFTVTAANATGTSAVSTTSNSVVPAGAGPLTFSPGAFPAATLGAAAPLAVTVTNAGADPAVPSAITTSGADVSRTGGTCSVGAAIAPSGSCTVEMTWTPTTVGELSGGSLTVAYPAGVSPSNSLSLTGTAALVAQSPLNSCVSPPRRLPRQGTRQLERPGCATSAGQRVGVRVGARRRGDVRTDPYFRLFCQISRTRTAATTDTRHGDRARYCRRGALMIRTLGKKLRVDIVWAAPAAGPFGAYVELRAYRT